MRNRLFDEYEEARDIFILLVDKIIDMNIVPQFIIQHVFDFIDDFIKRFQSSNYGALSILILEETLSTQTSTE